MEERAQMISRNITIVVGKEIRIKILLVPIGAILIQQQVQIMDRVQDGMTIPILLQVEGRIQLLIQAIIQGAHSIQGLQIVEALEAVLQEVHLVAHLVAHQVVVVDHVRGVGIKSNTFTYENFNRASAQWNCYAVRSAITSPKLYRNCSFV